MTQMVFKWQNRNYLDKLIKITLSVIVILLTAISVCIKTLLCLFDYFSQTPSSGLTIFNYLLPAILTLTIAITTIVHLSRQFFFNTRLVEIPNWANNKLIRGLMLLLISYAIIWQINYFYWLIQKKDVIVIMADALCIFCSLFLTIILVKPNRTK